MASNVIDYFATLGRKSLTCKSFESLWVNDKLSSPSEIWSDAITDIAIVHQGEELPDSSWQSIDRSIDNRPINSRSTIAVKRRGASKRLDHITKIKLIKKGDVIPLGFELIDRSISKMFPAEIENVGALAIKRAHASEVTFIQGQPLVDDICLVMVNDGEEVPEGYVSLERSPAQKDAGRAAKASQTVSRIVLAYHQRPAMGLCDLSYESTTLDRYPQKDQLEFPLPVVELPMFAFPHDLRLSYSSTILFPLPVFFSFVFTNSKGMHRYAACLRFYEIVPKEEIESVFRDVYGPEQDFVLPANTAVFCPKIICVVSRMPFYRAMRRYLCQIFSMSLSSLPCPLEFFIASVVGQVPLPVAGGRPFHVVQDAALISSTSCSMNAIEFEVPLPRFFPPMDLDFAAPLRCLSVDRLLAVFALMLRESKMVFLCCSNTLLTETMETLRSLLFPLKWSSCFVSRLPDALSGLLEAPGGFMIGLHMFEDKDNDVEVAESHVNKYFGDRKAVRQTKWTHSLTAGTFIVDLSSNAVFQYDGKSVQSPLSTSALNNLVYTLPPGPRKRLQRKLQHIATSYCIGPQTVGLDRFDSAFDFQAYEDIQEPAPVTALAWDNFPTLEIRDIFMSFMADLLGNYQKYIIPPLEDMSADTYRTFKEEFSVEEYLNDAGSMVRPILEMLVDTQMFAVLLQQRSEASDYSLVFFESAGELMREYKLQAGGHSVKDLSGNTFGSSSSIPDMIAPLYKLLAAKAWAAANGKYYHIVDSEKDQGTDGNDSPTSIRDSSEHSLPIEAKHEEKKYFSSLRGSSSRRTSISSPPFIKKDATKALKILTPIEHLLIALEEMEAEALKRSFTVGLATTPRKRGVVGARNELDKRVNLRLHDRSLGPLIIPGPAKSLLNVTLPHAISSGRRHGPHDTMSPDRIDDSNSVVTCSTDVSDDESVSLPLYSKAIAEFGISSPANHGEANYLMAIVALRTEQHSTSLHTEDANEVEYESDLERDSEGRFTYQIGWPVLHSKLLKLARRSVHTRLAGLRKSRVFALQMINRNIQLFLRAPTEQWACYRSIASNNEKNYTELDISSFGGAAKAANPAGPVYQNNLRNILAGSNHSASLVAESQVVISSALEVLSVSLLLLCTRTLHEAKPICDMLQVLGILAQADSMGVLPKFDETIWRTLLVACANTGGDVMRKVACVIFDTLTASGITPDALTYGSYTRALAATKYSQSMSPDGQQIDQFLYLEEIGLAWFQQRSAVIEQTQAEIPMPETKNPAQKSSGMLSSMFSRKKRSNNTVTRRRASFKSGDGFEATGASEAAITTAAQLGLVRPAAAFACLCPSGIFISAPPRYVASFQRTDTVRELSMEITGRALKLMMDYKCHTPSTWLDSRSQAQVQKTQHTTDSAQHVEELSTVLKLDKVSESDTSGNSSMMKDLFGPGAITLSTDSFDSKKTPREENGRNSTAFISSALGAAVSTSSAAASTAKHYSNILINGNASQKRHTISLPGDFLQTMVRSQGQTPNVSGSTEIPSPRSPPPPHLSRMASMSRMTLSVFHNPFNSKDKDKVKDTAAHLDPKLQFTVLDIMSNDQLEVVDVSSKGKDGGFSDDEADDSDDEIVSRRSSSASIRVKERRSGSYTADSNGGSGRCVSPLPLSRGQSPFEGTPSEHLSVNTMVNNGARTADLKKDTSTSNIVTNDKPTLLCTSKEASADTKDGALESPMTAETNLDELVLCPSDLSSLIDTPHDIENESLSTKSEYQIESSKPTSPKAAPSSDNSQRESVAAVTGPPVEQSTNTSPAMTSPAPLETKPTSTPTSNAAQRRLNVLGMQADVLSTFKSAFVREGCAVGIHCATPCPTCAYTLLDEEIMAAWSVADPKDPKRPRAGSSADEISSAAASLCESSPGTPPISSISDMRGSDIEAAHCIHCPVCYTKYSPQLHISCYELFPKSKVKVTRGDVSSASRQTTTAESTPTPSSVLFSEPTTHSPPNTSPVMNSNADAWSGGVKQKDKDELRVLWKESVSRLSPKGLRLALEEQMERIGERVADPCWLHVHQPAVYWNILWFSTMMKVPSGFLASPAANSKVHSVSERGPADTAARCGLEKDIGIRLRSLSVGDRKAEKADVSIDPNPPAMWHLPTIIGWREALVKTKVHRCLTKSSSTQQSSSTHLSSEIETEQADELQLVDFFPGCETATPEVTYPAASDQTASESVSTQATTPLCSGPPAMGRSISSPLIMTLLRNRSSSTPAKLVHEDPQVELQSPSPAASLVPVTPTPTHVVSSFSGAPSMRLDRAVEFFDDTAEGMRWAILEMGKYQWLMNEAKNAESFLNSNQTASVDTTLYNEVKHNTDDNSNNDFLITGNTANGDNTSGILPSDQVSSHIFLKRIADNNTESLTISRDIYVNLLTLFYMQKSKKVSESAKVVFNVHKSDLFKESPFEKLYLSVVRELLSPSDYQFLRTTERDMINCAAGNSAQAYRIGYGFLF